MRLKNTLFILAALAFASLPALAMAGGERIQVSDFTPGAKLASWDLSEKEGRAVYEVVKIDGLDALKLVSDRASFGLTKELSKFDIREYPFLNWRWRADKLPAGGDFRDKKTDDQAAQLYVSFPRGLTKLSTELVGYVWDNLAPKGTVGTSPAWSKLKVMVLNDGTDPLGQWVSHKRNVYEDYKRVFGEEPPKCNGAGVYINSQHTESQAISYFADIYFSKE